MQPELCVGSRHQTMCQSISWPEDKQCRSIGMQREMEMERRSGKMCRMQSAIRHILHWPSVINLSFILFFYSFFYISHYCILLRRSDAVILPDAVRQRLHIRAVKHSVFSDDISVMKA